jgi:hypothetical protein
MVVELSNVMSIPQSKNQKHRESDSNDDLLSNDPDSEKHLKGASDSCSRINDATCVLLATFGISKARYAIIEALDGVSGGRLGRFTCFLDPIARRFQWDSTSTKEVQREINALLKEQRSAGLEISNKGGRGRQVEIEGHIISYTSAKCKRTPGEFQLNIKRHALLVYEEARHTPGYRNHKSGTIEEVAHRRGKELLSNARGVQEEILESVHQVFDKSQGGTGERIHSSSLGELLEEDSLSGDARVYAPTAQTKNELIGGKVVNSAKPEIISAVAVQIEGLVSVGVARFSLRIVDIFGKARNQRRAVQGWNDLTPERMLELAPLAVQRCWDMVEQKNTRWNLILTPTLAEGVQLLQADDIDEELLDRLGEFAFQKYRTSDGDGDGNFQALIAVRSRDNTLPYRFKKTIGSDMGASLSVRVAGSYNAKPWRQRADGSYSVFTLIDDTPGLIVDEQQLINAGFISELIKKRELEEPASDTRHKKPLPDYSYFLERAEPRKDGSGKDISRIDFNVVRCIAERGYSFVTALRFLEKNSVIERQNKDAYFTRTVQAAFEDVNRPVMSESGKSFGEEYIDEIAPTIEPLENASSLHQVPVYAPGLKSEPRHNVPSISSQTANCDHCNAKISIGDPFCGECGTHMIWAGADELVAKG